MIICLNGIDGSGKSLQAQQLVSRLNEMGHPAIYVWTGGKRSVRGPLIRLGKRFLRAPRSSNSRRSGAGASQTIESGYRTYLLTTQRILKTPGLYKLWQHISLFEHAVEILVLVLPHLLQRRIVVCDRYLHDTVVRVAVLAGIDASVLPQQLRILRWYRVPRPSIGFLIDVPSEVAFSRKDDIPDIEFLKCRVPLYRVAATELKMHIVDGTGTPDEVAAQLWEKVLPILPSTGSTIQTEA